MKEISSNLASEKETTALRLIAHPKTPSLNTHKIHLDHYKTRWGAHDSLDNETVRFEIIGFNLKLLKL